jgi:transcriptional regulator with XRE-family HTH domain
MESPVVQRIRNYLKIQRFSIQQIADKLNMKPSTLGGKLNGSRELDIDTLESMVFAFPELSTEWLLRGTEPMEHTALTPDPELQAVCIEQAKEIYRLKQRIAELEEPKKVHA